MNNNGVYTLKPVERFFWTDYADLNDGTVQEKILNVGVVGNSALSLAQNHGGDQVVVVVIDGVDVGVV